MTDQIKGWLKVKLPNAISNLIDIVANFDVEARKMNCFHHQNQTRFDLMCLIDLFVKLGFNVTICDSIQLFDFHIQFSSLVLLVESAD